MTSSRHHRWVDWTKYLVNVLGPFLGLVMVLVIFTVINYDADRGGNIYLTARNVKTISNEIAIVATCGIGMTLVIIAGGIDLSVGSIVAVSSVSVALVFNGRFFLHLSKHLFAGHALVAWGTAAVITIGVYVISYRADRSWWKGLVWVGLSWLLGWLVLAQTGGVAALLAGVLIGMVCGLVNGAMITGTGVVPFIVTLGTMTIFRGCAQLMAGGRESSTVSVQRKLLEEQHAWLANLNFPYPKYSWLDSLPEVLKPVIDWFAYAPSVYLVIAASAMMIVVLSRLRLGRYIFAIGSNEQAARLSGIAVKRIKLWTYALAGMLAGLAGVMAFSRLRIGDSTAYQGLELDVIAAVVIGGGSLRGGEGSIVGTLIGAAIMGFMKSGCNLAQIDDSFQKIIVGSIIILAVALDEFRYRRQR